MNAFKVIGVIIGIIVLFWFLSSDSSSPEPTIAEVSCEQCQSDLEEATSRISNLESCVDKYKSRMSEINHESTMSAWEDYNTMGEALDYLEGYSSSAYNCE